MSTQRAHIILPAVSGLKLSEVHDRDRDTKLTNVEPYQQSSHFLQSTLPKAKACSRIPRALCFCIHAIWRPHGVPNVNALSMYSLYTEYHIIHIFNAIVRMLNCTSAKPIVLVTAVPIAHICTGTIV